MKVYFVKYVINKVECQTNITGCECLSEALINFAAKYKPDKLLEFTEIDLGENDDHFNQGFDYSQT